MKTIHLIFLTLFTLQLQAQKGEYPQQITLNSKSEGLRFKSSYIYRKKNASLVKTLKRVSNDSLTIELLQFYDENYFTYKVAVYSEQNKWVDLYKIDYKFWGSIIDAINIHESQELFFSIDTEKHRSWYSNLSRGKILEEGRFLLKLEGNHLYYKYFVESEYLTTVNYRTGTSEERNELQKLTIDESKVSFFFPPSNITKSYKINGVALNLVN